ncbi:restriction endonuclease subunit S, partial [Campylobacter coli]|nr:restriction endonuclease subunit S [Campylobacter coli]EKM9895090.1 restriction endonuclease subunit S [Campylobacter coli]EKS7250959.1 restriction endonuclease subunit S [Campylobacter coli]
LANTNNLEGEKAKPQIESNSFDLLIANPPYSVKGFLETLSDKSKNTYKLFNDDINIETNNSIECFFCERANQILNDNAKAAIILPSSILNKDSIYKNTREILFQNFDFIAIVELGNQTFGATGTNTIILFLRKKETFKQENHLISQDYSLIKERIEAENLKDSENFYQNYLSAYCDFRKFDKELYSNFLNGNLDSKLAELEAFKDYRNAFRQTSDYKKLKESKIYKESKDKQDLEDKAFLAYTQAIEKDKLLYFCLSLNQEVLIIKSPSDIKEQKKFLGYEWSNRKGDEGLKELHEPYLSPLFERGNPQNETKLNTLICKAFLKTLSDIPKDLQGYASKARLVDMIDFEKVEFNKAISLNPSNSTQSEMSNPFANSKYELVRLVEIENIKIQKGQNITQKLAKIGNIKVVAGGKDYAYFHNDFNRNENTITISASGANAGYVNFWKEKIFASDCTTINLPNLKVIQFIYYVLKCNQKYIMSLARGAAQPHVYPKDIENIKIPLPPLEIQKQIVAECEKVEEQYNTIRMSVEEYQNLIKAILQKCGIIDDGGGYELNSILDKINNLCKINLDSEFLSSFNKTIKEYALSNPIFKLSIGKRVLNNELLENGQIPVYSANVLEVFGFVNKEILQDYDNDSVLWGIDGDWMVGFIPKNKKFYPTDHCGVLRVDDTKINAKYISFILNEAGKKQGFSRKLRASIDRIKALRVKLPSLEFQDQIADITDKIEKKINEYKIELDRLEKEKEKILQKYLFS